jgi:hypothetical protein
VSTIFKSRFSRASIRRAIVLAFVLPFAGTVVAACGGSPSASVANLGSSTTSTTAVSSPKGDSGAGAPSGGSGLSQGNSGQGGSQLAMGGITVKYSECMQTHGVPDFPDPNAQGQVTLSGVNPGSASFESAQRACAKYEPNGGKAPTAAQQQQAVAQALKFTNCMRSHGITDFPDPQVNTSGGHTSIGIRINGNGSSSSDLNPTNPRFEAAQKACQSQLPGIGPTTKTSAA